jgi:hypothetical protein
VRLAFGKRIASPLRKDLSIVVSASQSRVSNRGKSTKCPIQICLWIVSDRNQNYGPTLAKENRMNVKKQPLGIKETTSEKPTSGDTERPKNPRANILPTVGYVLEIDGKFKSEHKTAEAAMTAGLELKKKYLHIQVVVYGAEDRTRTFVGLSGASEKKPAIALV